MCFSEQDGEIVVDADVGTCFLCGHCVALCPSEAIVHHEMDMDNFKTIDPQLTFDTDKFIEFVRARRSHRSFEDKKVPREDLETLVDLCRYAPTGSNRQTVEIIVIQDEDKLKRLSNLTVDFYEQSIDQVEKAVKDLEEAGQDVPADLRYYHDRLGLMRAMVMARSRGLDVVFHKAPAVMVFHSPIVTSTPKDDCVIAAHTVVMAAMTMGLGTCYIGLLEGAHKAYQPVRDELGLPQGHEVGSVLVVGYPKITFLRTVDRLPMKVRWE